ncbi:MAG TPA: biopolymer transporter ExbD [Polyangiaceae bacterium]|nr:biopolymer transporter ExbD [Polyangiaceae bacterium]
MGGVDVDSGGGKKRSTNSDINMIPFIDLLMVTIAFLLITAVWATNSRISSNTQVPGQTGCGEQCPPQQKSLHVHIKDDGFALIWKQGSTVVSEMTVPRQGLAVGAGDAATTRYPELAKALEAEWSKNGEHRADLDRKSDQAVLHAEDKLAFREMVAVMDAINAVKRDIKMPSGAVATVPAFELVLASR